MIGKELISLYTNTILVMDAKVKQRERGMSLSWIKNSDKKVDETLYDFSKSCDSNQLKSLKSKNKCSLRKKSLNVFESKYEEKFDDLKKVFGQISESEKLLYDCACALQKDIIHQGRFFACLTGFYFHSIIFKKGMQLQIQWDNIIALKRVKTAKLIPNAIQVTTKSNTIILTSFSSRDKAFLIMNKLLKLSSENLKMPPSEVNLWVQYNYGEDQSLGEGDTTLPTTHDKTNFHNTIQNQLKLLQQQFNSDEQEQELHASRKEKQEDQEQRGINHGQGGLHLLSVPTITACIANSGNFQSDIELNENGVDSSKIDNTDKENSSANVSSPSIQTKTRRNSLFPLKKPRSHSFEQVKIQVSKPEEIKRSSSKEKVEKQNESGKVATGNDCLYSINYQSSQELPDVVANEDQSFEESGPESDIVCHCGKHKELTCLIVDDVYQISVDDLFKQIFHKTNFWSKLLKLKRAKDVVLSPWSTELDKSGARVRNITYTLSLNYPFGPKHSPTTEKQTLHADSSPGEFYLVDTECMNNGLPYGEDFYIVNRYCISKISDDKCRIHITSQIKYRRKVWGLVKSFIEKNATSGILETFNIMGHLLRQEANQDGKEENLPKQTTNSSTRKKLLRKRPLEKLIRYPQQGSSDENQDDDSPTGDKSPANKTNPTSSVIMKHIIESVKKKHNQKFIFDLTFATVVQIVTIFAIALCFFNVFLYMKLWSLESVTSKYCTQLLLERRNLIGGDKMTDNNQEMIDHYWNKLKVPNKISSKEQWKEIISSMMEMMESMVRSMSHLEKFIDPEILEKST